MEIYTHFAIYLIVQLPVHIFYNFIVLGHVPISRAEHFRFDPVLDQNK
jgi:hypothetical protein